MEILVWIGFLVFVTLMVALDLGVFHRKPRAITIPEALCWTGIWIALALAFNVFVFFLYRDNLLGWTDTAALSGHEAAMQFLTGYLLEKSLSVDNIFVIAMIFSYFRIPLSEQHRVLFWGILGAVVLRGVMISLGSVLFTSFDWIVYVFGTFLIFSAARMLTIRDDNFDPEAGLAMRTVRRFYPVTKGLHGSRFFVDLDGVRHATPLFLTLVLVETSDVMFAVDSIPAIFAVTSDPFLVFTSNIFAILGLRSLYFALAGLIEKFRYLKHSLVFVLAYVGVKMLLSHHYPIPNAVSLSLIAGIMSVGVLASIWAGHRDSAALRSPVADHIDDLMEVTYRQARQVFLLLTASTVLLIGGAMLILPGPNFVLIPMGLALLVLELVWTRRWLARIRKELGGAETVRAWRRSDESKQ
ncbi:MAG: TerC/Alx family metal homeostasis membrane protein [Xanthomonadales bacterium]|nr:TerC/Alx family metal homeostasis membrane protein [Xanthomonadales bacterium]